MNTSLAATIFLVFACGLRGQTSGSVIEDELKQLSHPSSRPVNVSCGSDHRNRLTASSLAEGGRAAIPILVGALSEVESAGPRSSYFANANWILLSLAKIQGPSSLPLLRRLMNTTEHLQQSLDAAVSLALGITSYVSASSDVIPGGTCNRFGEPRFALARLALGCQTLDLAMIESALGPTAKLALASLIRRKRLSVIVLRSQIANVDYHSAVGFKLSAPDQWSEPIEPLYPRRVLEQPFETSSADSLKPTAEWLAIWDLNTITLNFFRLISEARASFAVGPSADSIIGRSSV